MFLLRLDSNPSMGLQVQFCGHEIVQPSRTTLVDFLRLFCERAHFVFPADTSAESIAASFILTEVLDHNCCGLSTKLIALYSYMYSSNITNHSTISLSLLNYSYIDNSLQEKQCKLYEYKNVLQSSFLYEYNSRNALALLNSVV